MTAPFAHLVTKKSTSNLPSETLQRIHRELAKPSVPVLDDWVLGSLGLARGSVFVADEHTVHPYAIVATVRGRRTHVVVAREYGDVTFPAYVDRQRNAARGDVARIARERFADVRQWFAEGRHVYDAYLRSLATEGADL